jgi:uncharacterized membrane protein YheB (UPF0754 family)
MTILVKIETKKAKIRPPRTINWNDKSDIKIYQNEIEKLIINEPTIIKDSSNDEKSEKCEEIIEWIVKNLLSAKASTIKIINDKIINDFKRNPSQKFCEWWNKRLTKLLKWRKIFSYKKMHIKKQIRDSFEIN